MNTILTIVIPAYNIGKLAETVLATVCQEETKNAVEILFIDDGSTDRTLEIAEAWAKVHDNMKVITKENGGHGSVINCGMERAQGRYLKVVDGDDFVEKRGLVELVAYLQQCHSDYVISPYYLVNASSGKRKVQYIQDLIPGHSYQFEDVAMNLGRIPFHALTIRTEMLQRADIHLTENCYYDDFQYVLYPIPYVKTLSYFEFPVYDYVVGQENQSVNAKVAYQNLPMFLKIFDDSVAYVTKIGRLSYEKRKSIQECMNGFLKNIYNVYLKNAYGKCVYHDFLQFDRMIHANYPNYEKVAKQRYRYISIASGSPVSFYVVGGLMKLYMRTRE